ncbi:flagellar hook-associated protein FlgK [Bordetella genomosp. 12]|uniref:Flagellar hook-associated protein 1 n=1 Tax=Bordetella genomosp. 12 TaxID=463035 RepID=A0A261VKL0_9BORD|nr:flagellar hook-associated protein FlgK [Bordetella genomosp. 12]OZI74676.1 flagellar hook-associated protein FlgK [Bordetella genomosp. 12]
MNLYNLAMTGLNASQAGLEVTSHNITNAATDGYSRQRLVTSTAGAAESSQGFYGRGVQVDTVKRQYDSFLYKQLVGAKGSAAQLSAQYDQLSAINNQFSDRTVGLTPALSAFFSSLNSAASSPADAAVRQDLSGKTSTLVTQLNSAYQQLENQRDGLNTQVSSAVSQVNSYLERINDLNQQITVARSKSNQPPNDLLDQRDSALSELNELVGVRWYEQGDSLNISLQSGQTLLSGRTVYPLAAVNSATDASRTALAYTLPDGQGGTQTVELKDEQVSGGTLGGLLSFRSSALDAVEDQLGQLALGLALSVNAQSAKGLDLDGQPGGDVFTLKAPNAIPNAGNSGTVGITSAYTDAAQIHASAYKIEYDAASGYKITRLSDNTAVSYTTDSTTGAMSFDGVTITPDGLPADGDSWEFKPTRDAARDITLALTDPNQWALADGSGGTTNGQNGLELAKLQTAKVLNNGSTSLNEQFSQLINNVGVQTQQVKTAMTAADNLTAQQQSAFSSVSGVNLNEEYVNLAVYQEQYQASAKIIDVASQLFDTLLGLR